MASARPRYLGFDRRVDHRHPFNSHINRLRAKIERDPAKPCFIQKVWGVGYRFAEA